MMFPDMLCPAISTFRRTTGTIIGGEISTSRNWLSSGDDLAKLRGTPITDDEMRHSIAVYNENRKFIRELYAFRAERPWQAPAAEVYLMVRAGIVLPAEEHTLLLREYLAAARANERPERDNCRIVLTGMFCEQPPLNLIKSLEMSGCYVVDDDLLLVTRWLTGDVDIEGESA